jgi:hypothetical protein
LNPRQHFEILASMTTTPFQLVQLMRTLWITAALIAATATTAAAEHRVTSPDGRLKLILS